MDKKLLTIAGFLVYLWLLPVQSVCQVTEKTMKRLPDTGQTKSYTNTWGEDSDYIIHPPAFKVLLPGIVLDTVTGLMWQQADSGEMTYENAIKYADTLMLGGFNDWRLPTAHESFSIFNHQTPNPAHDATYFTKTGAEYWWTSDKQVNDANKVWVTNGGGGIGNHAKTETISAGGTKKYHGRCVRNMNQTTFMDSRFTDNSDGTITDNLTHLMWVKIPSSGQTWEEGLQYAESLNMAGFTDWRLPNIKELRSLNDERRTSPSIDKTYFPQFITGRYWSSTSLPNQITKAWFWDTQFGITSYESKLLSYNTLFVRNMEANTSATLSEQAEIFRVHPNPFSQFLEIEGLRGDEKIELYSNNHVLVFSSTDGGLPETSVLPGGIYHLIITQENGNRSTMIIQKM